MNDHMKLISELDVAIFHAENAMNMMQKLTHSKHPDAKLRVIVDQLKLSRDVQLALLKRNQVLAELN